MACSNCFNGCAGITSDQCVKYTGLSIPALGITNGDPLSKVEESITTILTEVLTGTNIVPVIDPDIICTLVHDFLPLSNVTLVDYLNALIQAACSLQTQLDVEVARIDKIEANYTVGCLTVAANAGTHDVLQAAIIKVCSINASLGALALNLSTNYTKTTDLDAYIANYLATHTDSSTKVYKKMIPYVAYPFFGDLTGKFGANGVGIPGTDWEKIYLCNGYDSLTPDLRGRMPVGDTDMMGAFPPDAFVLPGGFNPTYTATFLNWDKRGANSIALIEAQMPQHTHAITVTLNNPTHTHYTVLNNGASQSLSNATPIQKQHVYGTGVSGNYDLSGTVGTPDIGLTSPATANVSVASASATNAGSGQAHANNQPAIASYYIMYIP